MFGWLLLLQLFCYLPAHAAGKFAPITGIITDNNGKPLAGVTVIVKGERKGVSTDESGKFTINAKSGDVLVFSFIGYKTKEVRLGAETTISIQDRNWASPTLVANWQ